MEFLLSEFANRFELRCEPKRLMLLYYKIWPCSANGFTAMPLAKTPFNNGHIQTSFKIYLAEISRSVQILQGILWRKSIRETHSVYLTAMT